MFGGTKQPPYAHLPNFSSLAEVDTQGFSVCPVLGRLLKAMACLPPKLLMLFIAHVLRETDISATTTTDMSKLKLWFTTQSLVRYQQLQISRDELALSPSRSQQSTKYAGVSKVWGFAFQLHFGRQPKQGSEKWQRWDLGTGRSFFFCMKLNTSSWSLLSFHSFSSANMYWVTGITRYTPGIIVYTGDRAVK